MHVALPARNLRLTRDDNRLKVRRRDLLEYPAFRRLLTAQVMSQTADAASSVLLAALLLFAGDDGPTVSRLIALVLTTAAPLVVAGPVGGMIADRFTRRTTLAAGQMARATAVVLCLGAVASGLDGLAFALWGAGLCLSRVVYTARVASIRHLVRHHELVAADSISLTLGGVAGAAGASLGLVVNSALRTNGLLLVALAHAASGAVFLRIGTNIGGGRDHTPAAWRKAFAHLNIPKMRYTMLATSTFRACLGVYLAAAVLIGDGYGDGSPLTYVGALGACGAGTFLGNIPAEYSNEHVPRRVLTVLSHSFAGVLLVISAAIQSPVVYLAAIAVVAAVFQNLRVCSDATVQSNAVAGAGGREFAVHDMAHNLSFLAGILVGLATSAGLGNRGTVLMSAAALLLLGGVYAFLPRGEESVPVDHAPDNGGIHADVLDRQRIAGKRVGGEHREIGVLADLD